MKKIIICIAILLMSISCHKDPQDNYIGTYIIKNNSDYPIVIELLYNDTTSIHFDSVKSNVIIPSSTDTIFTNEFQMFGLIEHDPLIMRVYHYLGIEPDTLLYSQQPKYNKDLWDIDEQMTSDGPYLTIWYNTFTFEFNNSYITK